MPVLPWSWFLPRRHFYRNGLNDLRIGNDTLWSGRWQSCWSRRRRGERKRAFHGKCTASEERAKKSKFFFDVQQQRTSNVLIKIRLTPKLFQPTLHKQQPWAPIKQRPTLHHRKPQDHAKRDVVSLAVTLLEIAAPSALLMPSRSKMPRHHHRERHYHHHPQLPPRRTVNQYRWILLLLQPFPNPWKRTLPNHKLEMSRRRW